MTHHPEQDRSAQRAWEEALAAGPPTRPATTESGIDVDVLYTPNDLKDQDYEEEIGYPGQFPFVRGVYPAMYRARHWTMRQYAGFGTAEESNARYRSMLAQGQTGLSVAFDLPTQLGHDSDDPLAVEEVGRVGVAIDTLADMESLFEGIDLGKISTNLTINAPAAIILAMYIAVGEKQGIVPQDLRGTTQNDILKEYLARKTYIFPPQPSMRLAVDVIEYCMDHLPHFNPISVTGYHARESGASAIQEVAFTLASAVAYVEQVLERGYDVDAFAPQLSFHFTSCRDFFEEIAKIRAARRLWAGIVRDEFQAKKPRSMMLRYFCGGSGASLTAADPLANIIRGTLQCLAGVLAGAQACHVPAYDEAFDVPSEESARLALRTQHIIAYESGVANTADPLGGSYYLETLTNRIEVEIRALMDDIRASGGMVAAIERGDPQRMILDRSYETWKQIEEGQKIVVGVNAFQAEPASQDWSPAAESIQPDGDVVERQQRRLARVKAGRDESQVHQALACVREAAGSGDNMMPVLLEAVKAYASVGEICTVLREEFGEFREQDVV